MALDHVQLAMPAGMEDVARGFYEGLLGLTEVQKPLNLAGRGGCWFERGEARIHLGIDPAFSPARKAHPAFLVDDLDGSAEEVETVHLSLDGADFEIDLSAQNADRLRGKLAKFIENGTRVTAQKPRRTLRAVRPAPSGRDQVQAVRDWARKHGLTVSDRGRIAKSVQEAFDAAH